MVTTVATHRVAVIGAGLAGASCAHELKQLGLSPHVFDMGFRGPGGRANTRSQDGWQFDHGCQFIQASSPDMQAIMQRWEQAGVATRWLVKPVHLLATGDGKATQQPAGNQAGFCNSLQSPQLFVGQPGMDAVCRHLTAGCTTSWAHKVTALHRDGGGTWTLDVTDKAADSSQRMGGFNGIVLADYLAAKAGSPGTLNLEEVGLSHLQQQLRQTNPTPAFSLMVAVRGSLAGSSFQAASISGHRLQWLSCDSSKPGRERQDGAECWVAVASQDFSRQLLEDVPLQKDGRPLAPGTAAMAAMARRMWREVQELLRGLGVGEPEQEPLFMQVQRWGSAFKANPLPEECLMDERQRVAVCGDMFRTSSAEGAVLSGLAAAKRMRDILMN